MDLAKSIVQDSILEILEVNNQIAHPYDDFMNDNGSSEKDKIGSWANFINDEAAESTPSSSSWQLPNQEFPSVAWA